jgi:hypothetical protein
MVSDAATEAADTISSPTREDTMLDANWDQWRTTTVVGICKRIRETGDYSALPILADALQDADCDDAKVLKQLRSALKPTRALRLVCLIEGGKPAEAVKWMDEFVKEFSDGFYQDAQGEWVDVEDEEQRNQPGVKYVEEFALSYDDLMEAAETYLKEGEWCCLPFDTPEVAYDASAAKQFWKHYETITGTKVGKRSEFFFHCAC